MSNDFEVWCTEVARCAERNGWDYDGARYALHNYHRDHLRVCFAQGEGPQEAARVLS